MAIPVLWSVGDPSSGSSLFVTQSPVTTRLGWPRRLWLGCVVLEGSFYPPFLEPHVVPIGFHHFWTEPLPLSHSPSTPTNLISPGNDPAVSSLRWVGKGHPDPEFKQTLRFY